MEETDPFREIIQGCKEHDRKSQKELYRMYYAYGMSITLRYADSRDKAAEILNDAFMDVFTNIQTYDPERPFKPWLRQIVIYKAINHYHKEQNMKELESLDRNGQAIAREASILSRLNYEDIIEMVQKLTPAYRTVFNLFVIEGFKHAEIASMLGISVGTSKSNLSKAKQNLKTLLEKNLT